MFGRGLFSFVKNAIRQGPNYRQPVKRWKNVGLGCNVDWAHQPNVMVVLKVDSDDYAFTLYLDPLTTKILANQLINYADKVLLYNQSENT